MDGTKLTGARRGSILIEALVALVIAAVGLLALGGTMSNALQKVLSSGSVLASEESLSDKADKYLLERSITHDNSAEEAGAARAESFEIKINDSTIKAGLYSFSDASKSFYKLNVFQREE